jgi:hypothetical protein
MSFIRAAISKLFVVVVWRVRNNNNGGCTKKNKRKTINQKHIK